MDEWELQVDEASPGVQAPDGGRSPLPSSGGGVEHPNVTGGGGRCIVDGEHFGHVVVTEVRLE